MHSIQESILRDLIKLCSWGRPTWHAQLLLYLLQFYHSHLDVCCLKEGANGGSGGGMVESPELPLAAQATA